MKCLTTPINRSRGNGLRAAVFSSRARAAIAAETLHHGENETGGLLLGHRCGPLWYIVESVDPGPASTRGTAHFAYDQGYLNHLINKLRWYYAKPLDLLGLWHRHPGSFDRFSAPDMATNRRFLAEYPQGVLSALVNLDPVMRLTVYAVDETGGPIIPFAAGDGLFPPALLSYRGGKPAASAAALLSRALAGRGGAPVPRETPPSSLEELIGVSESDFAFLAPLCGKLTMKAAADGLVLEEDGAPLLRLLGGAASALLLVGETGCRYRSGLIAASLTKYILRGKENGPQ